MLGRGSSSAAEVLPRLEKGVFLIPTHLTLNTSSTVSSGCSRSDRFSKHFNECRNGQGQVKASAILPVDHVVLQCPIHRPIHGMHNCPEI